MPSTQFFMPALNPELATSGKNPLAKKDTTGACDSDSDASNGSSSLIAAYVVYYGRKMGIFKKWSDVEKYTKGFGENYEGFSTVTAARQSWSQALASGTWGIPQSVATKDKETSSSLEGDRSDPIVAPIPPAHQTLQKVTLGANTSPPPDRSSTTANTSKTEYLKLSSNSLTAPNPLVPDGHVVNPSPQQFAQVPSQEHEQFFRPRVTIYDEVYYAVLSGRSPGVYLGRDDAAYAAGTNGRTVIYRSTSKAKADAVFTKAYNNEGVILWDVIGTGHIHASIL